MYSYLRVAWTLRSFEGVYNEGGGGNFPGRIENKMQEGANSLEAQTLGPKGGFGGDRNHARSFPTTERGIKAERPPEGGRSTGGRRRCSDRWWGQGPF